MGRGGDGRRSEHLHVGTHVRVGEHPKQIGLAQPLARDAHGDAPDELWLESMAYLWGEGRCSEHLPAGREHARGCARLNSGAPAILGTREGTQSKRNQNAIRTQSGAIRRNHTKSAVCAK